MLADMMNGYGFNGYPDMNRMMGGDYGTGQLYSLHVLLGTLTWIAFIALLISLARWFWLGGNKK